MANESAPTTSAIPLDTVYRGWESFQKRMVEVIAPLSADQLALPVSSAHWPIGMLVQHMLNDRIWWFHLWMNEGSPDITSFMHWEEEEEGRSVHSAAELVTGLAATWELIQGTLARNTVADLEYVFPQPSSLTERERRIFGPQTRQEIIWHVIRHDLHHGGELAVGFGDHGMPLFWG